MWFLATRPRVTLANFFAEFFQVRELPVYFEAALLSRINPIHGRTPLPLLLLALRRWLSLPTSDSRYSDFVKVFFADHVHACSGTYQTLFPLVFLWMGLGDTTPQKVNRMWLCLPSWLKNFSPDKFSRVSAGASLLSFNLLLRPVLQFHSVRTALMKKFDLYFTKRWTFSRMLA